MCFGLKTVKHGFATLNVDMEKSYDRVEWGFLEEIMIRMGFHERWIQLIMVCISTVKFTILQDSMELGPVIPQSGLRQGDHLSPYLFIICAETLSSLIQAKESSRHIHRCRIARGAPIISHFFFANDCFIYFRANENEVHNVSQALLEYGAATRQRVNFNKSSISFSRNVCASQQDTIYTILEVRGTSDYDKYLGIPFLIGRSKQQVFNYLKDCIWKWLTSWNSKKLS